MSEEIKPKKERKFLKALGKIGEVLIQELFFRVGSNLIRKIGGKKTLPSILFLLASLSLFAQFPNTGNKQRLGFQTTADGLVWRGALSDTASIQPINNQSAWVILDTVNLKIYSFDFTSNVWNLVGGAQGLTMPFDSITFNTAKDGTVGVGEVEYNDTQGSLIQGLKGGNVTNVIGQQLHQRVNNQTGAPLAKGDVVYLAGSQGNRITVAKGLAVTDAFSANTFGVVAESIADNASGFIITEGLITGLNTSALTEDSAVYLSPTVAGALTSTKPQAPQHSVYIGVCVKSNNGSGELFVKIRNGLEMDELHDTRITNPVTGATLYYSGGLWRDTTAALLVSDTASMLIPYLRKLDTITLSNRINTKLNISDTASMLLPYLRDADTVTLSNRINLKLNIADTSAFARDNQISGTSGQVAYFNSSNSVISDAGLIYNATNKSLGINTTTTSGANLIIKNSQEPVRTIFISTQTFGADTTNWTRGAGWTFNGTQAVATAATGNLTYIGAAAFISNIGYEVTFTLSNYTSGSVQVVIGNYSVAITNLNLTQVTVHIPTNTSGGLRFTTTNFSGNLDNISVVQISNPSVILFSGQSSSSSILYMPMRMPNSSSLIFGGGGNLTTGINNTFIGNEAGVFNTSGNNNNFFGYQAGNTNNIGIRNNFYGNRSGANNTTGSENNFFGHTAGLSNVSGSNNNFFGTNAGQRNTIGDQNNFFGYQAGLNNLSGSNNMFFGTNSGLSNISGSSNFFFGSTSGNNNTTGSNNLFFGFASGFLSSTGNNNAFFGTNSGRSNKTGSSNIFLGVNSGYNITLADTLTGSNNIVIGTNAADNIASAAAGNVAIGNSVDLPTKNGSNQGVYQNVLFFTGASGVGTTIAAASKAGIKTNAPNRDLEVAGEVRITDLTTDAPTRLVGADADGDLGQVTLGAGLNLASSSLLADTNFLVTRFDTASMLTNYLRSGVAASTYLPLTGGTLNINSSTNFLNTANDNANLTLYNSNSNGTNTIYNGLKFFVGAAGGAIAGGEGQANIYAIRRGSNLPGTDLSFILKGAGVNENEMLERLRIKYDGKIGIGTSSPSYLLDVNGTLGVTGATTLNESLTLNRAGVPLFINSTNSNLNKISLQDNTTVRSYLGAGSTKLFTVANSSVDEKFSVSNDGNTVISGSINVNSSAVFNEGSTDSDFRVESDGNAHMVFVDASTDRVGIGTNSPTKTLDVNGELNVLSAGTFGGRLNTNWLERTYSNSTSTSLTVSVNTTWLKLENNSTITLTLPNAATYPGKELHIKNAGTGAVNSLSSNIESLNSTTIGTAILASGGGKWATLVSDGTYWVIMAGN